MKKLLFKLLLALCWVQVRAQTNPPYPTAPISPQNIIAAEYFIDTDPGLGNGTSISITPGVNLSNKTAAINTAGLVNGVHRVYIRTKSGEGNWSMANVKDFIVNFDPTYSTAPIAPQNIIAAEYFIDTDPGLGNGTSISITPGVNLSNKTVAINTAGLVNGVHRVYIRTKSGEGNWSMANVKDFIVNFDPTYSTAPIAPQNIIAAEYFIDTDPGLGNGTSITITPGVNLSNKTVAINTAGLVNGVHRVYLRTKSGEGNWSITNVKDFTVSLDPAYPTTPIAPQNIIAAEYFIDTDPGPGNGTSISITPGVNQSNKTVAINTSGLVVGVHRVYLRTKSGEGNWSMTNVKDFTVSLDPAYPTTPIAPQNIIAAEYFIDTDPGPGNGTSISITPGVNQSNKIVAINTSGLVVGVHRVYLRTKSGEGNYSLTNVDSFHVTNPLSLNLLTFSGIEKGNDVLLNWSTVNESQTSFFEVEYSLDAVYFEPIGKVLAHNNPETQHYNYLHPNVPQAILYYRLRQVDKNGSFTFSNTITINRLKNTDLVVWLYPNPTEKTITVQNLKMDDLISLEIISPDGKTVQILTARSDMQYDVSALSAGVYYLQLMKKGGEKSKISFVKR